MASLFLEHSVYCTVYIEASSRVSGRAVGRQFVVAFPQHHCTLCPAAARLYVTSSSWTPLDVAISLPGHVTGRLWPASQAPAFTQRSYRLHNIGDSVELELPSPVHLDGTNIENKGALIQSVLYTRPKPLYAECRVVNNQSRTSTLGLLLLFSSRAVHRRPASRRRLSRRRSAGRIGNA